MSPPLEADFGAVVITDLVGSEETPFSPLAAAIDKGFPLLEMTIRHLVEGTLAPLHEFCSRENRDPAIPHIAITQRDLLDNWLDNRVRSAIWDQINSDSSLRVAGTASEVRDSGRLLNLPNVLPPLLERNPLGTDDEPVLLPRGAVHGDPNFDNVFVAYSEADARLSGLALIDFEWCRCGPADSPYDDLCKIECELLFNRDFAHRVDLLLECVLGDPWISDNRPLAAAIEPTGQVYAALRLLRRRAADLAKDAGGAGEQFQRAYFITLLGQAARYVGYPGLSSDARAGALLLCQLLAHRLSRPLAQRPRVGVSGPVDSVGLAGGTSSQEDDVYRLEAAGEGYASLIFNEIYPVGDFSASALVKVDEIHDRGWLTLSMGVNPRAPHHTGLGGILRSQGGGTYEVMIHSHRSSRHRTLPESFEKEGEKKPELSLDLTLVGNSLRFGVRRPSGDLLSEVELTFPAEEYTGPIALVVHAAEVQVQVFRVVLPEGEHAPDAISAG